VLSLSPLPLGPSFGKPQSRFPTQTEGVLNDKLGVHNDCPFPCLSCTVTSSLERLSFATYDLVRSSSRKILLGKREQVPPNSKGLELINHRPKLEKESGDGSKPSPFKCHIKKVRGILEKHWPQPPRGLGMDEVEGALSPSGLSPLIAKHVPQ
jgi:hypothetical protein